MSRGIALTIAAAAFALAATANSGGYRYGVSDQAFYATAVIKDLQPALFPRDSRLLETQSRLQVSDEMLAVLARWTHLDLPPLFLAVYVATIVVLFAGAVAFARAAGFSWWAAAALLVLLTFRHRIAKTGANSLEGYMHPRELAFGLGVLALAAFLRRGYMWMVIAIAGAALWHSTTAFWFAVVLGVALVVSKAPRWTWLAAGAVIAIVAIAGAASLGLLAGRLTVMDADWLRVLVDKDYLFPHQWPLYAWLANLAYPAAVLAIHRRRQGRGVTVRDEGALVTGLLMLVPLFLLSLPFTTARVAIAVQAQVTRVFWLLDFAAAAFLAWWLMDDLVRDRPRVRAAIVSVLACASLGRGLFLLGGADSDRRLIRIDLPPTPWVEMMRWFEAQPAPRYILADPGHAWKYGVSVRLAAKQDTLIEAGKDTALAMYDREVAMAVGDRLTAVGDFDRLTAGKARALRERYGVDAVIVERAHALELPVLHANSAFVAYDLR